MGLFGRRETQPAVYMLSGYRDEGEYETRQPGWEGDQEFPDLDSAVTAAQSWQQANGNASTVEVIALRGRAGTVVRVIDRNGVEIIN